MQGDKPRLGRSSLSTDPGRGKFPQVGNVQGFAGTGSDEIQPNELV